jgi:glutathione S-transferase
MSTKLYSDRFWISPWVFSCWVALKEKGVPFELVELGLDKKETRTESYTRLSTTAKVPALEHDSFAVAESSAILEYIEETWPMPRLFPSEARPRARARQVMSFLRTDVFQLREERPTSSMFYEHAKEPMSAKCQADADKLVQVASAFVGEGATSLFGMWSIADSELAFCLQRLGLNGYPLPARLRAFVEAQWARPSVAEYVAHARAPYVPY